MSKLIIIRGKVNAGKTTTAGLVYEKILSSLDVTNHSFNGKDVGDLKQSKLKYNKKGNIKDFATTLIVDGKTVSIISAGDVADSLDRELNAHIAFADIIICCTRTLNIKGSSYKMIEEKYENNNPIILEQLVSKDKNLEVSIVKKEATDNILNTIVSTKK